MFREQVGLRYSQYHYDDNKTVRAMMMTFEQKILVGELLKCFYKEGENAGIFIYGKWVCLLPFPPREDRANIRRVGANLRDSQSKLKEP